MTAAQLPNLLNLLLPDATQTDFLRAALRGDLNAWNRYCQRVGDPKTALGHDTLGIKRLVPQLYVSLRDAGAELDAEFVSYLRAAHVREELRARTFSRICESALQKLGESGADFRVLKGVSLVESAYENWALRHCHDVDLWLRRADCERAISVLKSENFEVFETRANTTILVHPTNLPISLHPNLFAFACDTSEFWVAQQTRRLGQIKIPTLSSEAELVHLLGHAATQNSRRSLLWCSDAWRLLQSAPDFEARNFVNFAQKSGLAPAISAMSGFLKTALSAPIKAEIIENLGSCEGDVSRILEGIHATAPSAQIIRSARRWNEKKAVSRWILARVARK